MERDGVSKRAEETGRKREKVGESRKEEGLGKRFWDGKTPG